jgi:hypothetical protein
MSEFYVLSPAELQKVGLTCEKCKTEIVYELDSTIVEIPSQCPVCQPEVFGSQPTRALDWYRKLKKLTPPGAVRLYFRKAKEGDTAAKS